jgi:hypothetical protein
VESAYRSYCGLLKNYGRYECLTDAQQQVQSTLSKARTSVKWLFAKLAGLILFGRDPSELRLTGNPVQRLPNSVLHRSKCFYSFFVVLCEAHAVFASHCSIRQVALIHDIRVQGGTYEVNRDTVCPVLLRSMQCFDAKLAVQP